MDNRDKAVSNEAKANVKFGQKENALSLFKLMVNVLTVIFVIMN